MKLNTIILYLTFTIVVILTISCREQKDIIREVRDSVVRIETRYKSTQKRKDYIGTGFFIGKNLIATAYHVSLDYEKEKNDYRDFEIVMTKHSSVGANSFVTPIELVKYDAINDLAIYTFDPSQVQLQWDDFNIKPLEISELFPNIGEEVCLTGYFSSYTYPFSSKGIVSSITENNFRPDNNNTTFNQAILCNLTTIPGHSGGPVVSLESNKVVGINTRVLTPNDDRVSISISTSSTYLLNMLQNLNSTQEKK